MLSGNQCAFTDCLQPIIDTDGTYVATLCHIEAALPGGERFRSSMTNRERASFGNLLLMCERHHRVTDDVQKFPVEVMQDIKSNHEARFSEGVRRYLAGVEDDTLANDPRPAETLRAFTEVYGYEPGGLEIRTHLAQLQEVLATIAQLSRPARQLLAVMLRHGAEDGDAVRVSQQLVLDVTGLQRHDLLQRVSQLDKRNLAWVDDDENYDPASGAPFVVVEARFLDEWPNVLWDLRQVATKLEISLERLLVNLDFTALD